jgi:predicted  nucleic acid-binding Zn-ribbon protein
MKKLLAIAIVIVGCGIFAQAAEKDHFGLKTEKFKELPENIKEEITKFAAEDKRLFEEKKELRKKLSPDAKKYLQKIRKKGNKVSKS